MPMSRANDPFNTHQLRVLVALLTERNVTRVATRMNQSQPAISAALRKLRKVFQDELLVRSGAGMAVTPRGEEILATAREALSHIDSLLTQECAFDAASTQQFFKIGCPDYLATVFLSGVTRVLRRDAPVARLLVHPLGPDYHFEQALADGELDVVIGNWPDPPQSLHIAPLLEDQIVCLISAQHPLARQPMTREQYLRAAHVVPLPFSSTHRGVIDRHLAALRLTRNARVVVPFFSMAPHLLPGTDLIFTISRHFAEHYARILPLVVVPCPIDFPNMSFYQIWHARSQHSEAHRWLRGLLHRVASQVLTGYQGRSLRDASPASSLASTRQP